ncbi:hypothetical protein PYCCODRAFT_1104095 [Trametes coccinea BRFM310]|uniref:Uncharacterized protein n=1 Tax=Trametes coccinea (strain BRFM310) TaxID=1353009 RepID=A0A1Y2ID08_TRAC3|nr:hypothetical protein PYCCODRAFT_1104095 [Trametes coccinea BRFM310]
MARGSLTKSWILLYSNGLSKVVLAYFFSQVYGAIAIEEPDDEVDEFESIKRALAAQDAQPEPPTAAFTVRWQRTVKALRPADSNPSAPCATLASSCSRWCTSGSRILRRVSVSASLTLPPCICMIFSTE